MEYDYYCHRVVECKAFVTHRQVLEDVYAGALIFWRFSDETCKKAD